MNPHDVKVNDSRAEQFVAGEWVEVPTDDLTLITEINNNPRLMRGDREVGGKWRLFINGKLVCDWDPVRDWRKR